MLWKFAGAYCRYCRCCGVYLIGSFYANRHSRRWERKEIMGAESLPPIMTISQVAKQAGVPELTVRRLAREGTIPALKLGRQWRIKRELLEKWMGKRSIHSLSEIG